MLPRKPLLSTNSQCSKTQGLHFQIANEGEILSTCRLTGSNRDHLCDSSWQLNYTGHQICTPSQHYMMKAIMKIMIGI